MAVGVEDTGSTPVLKVGLFRRLAPFVRDKEDVSHEAALPDLYGLEGERAIEEAIESGELRWSVNLRTGETVLSRRSNVESKR